MDKKRREAFKRLCSLVCMVAFLGAACSHAPVKGSFGYNSATGEQAARAAISMVGKSYKYGGDSPAGFDCSGLVRYSYRTAGLDLPHGTNHLKAISRSVGKRGMQKGDILFFDEKGGKYSHVGIYIGSNQFIHAPNANRSVQKESLHDPYWENHFRDARRLY
ncbi:MAG: C40 family peptidase [Nitrospirota bacterium]